MILDWKDGSFNQGCHLNTVRASAPLLGPELLAPNSKSPAFEILAPTEQFVHPPFLSRIFRVVR